VYLDVVSTPHTWRYWNHCEDHGRSRRRREREILLREYGANAKIIGIADHSGCAELQVESSGACAVSTRQNLSISFESAGTR
jgi:hypothetical protein